MATKAAAGKRPGKSASKKKAGVPSPKTGSVKKAQPKKSATGSSAKKTSAKAAAKKAGGREYSAAAGAQVAREMREMKVGTLKSGRSGQTVTNPKQAIAIGLSEARRAGKKVAPDPNRAKK